jgi:hypothetical protein
MQELPRLGRELHDDGPGAERVHGDDVQRLDFLPLGRSQQANTPPGFLARGQIFQSLARPSIQANVRSSNHGL